MKMHNVIVTICVASLVGCNTTPIAVPQAIQTPPERIFSFQKPTIENFGTIVVIRDEGFLGGGCYFSLYINSLFSARMNPKEIARFYVEPGEILLRVGSDPQGGGLCGVGKGDNWIQRETMIKPGETKYFRLSLDTAGKFDISRTEP
jgi:hypothetical protein